MTASTDTVTESLVRTSCGGTSKTQVLRSTHLQKTLLSLQYVDASPTRFTSTSTFVRLYICTCVPYGWLWKVRNCFQTLSMKPRLRVIKELSKDWTNLTYKYRKAFFISVLTSEYLSNAWLINLKYFTVFTVICRAVGERQQRFALWGVLTQCDSQQLF